MKRGGGRGLISYPVTNEYMKTLFKISTFCLGRGMGEKERGRREGGGGGERGREGSTLVYYICLQEMGSFLVN